MTALVLARRSLPRFFLFLFLLSLCAEEDKDNNCAFRCAEACQQAPGPNCARECEDACYEGRLPEPKDEIAVSE